MNVYCPWFPAQWSWIMSISYDLQLNDHEWCLFLMISGSMIMKNIYCLWSPSQWSWRMFMICWWYIKLRIPIDHPVLVLVKHSEYKLCFFSGNLNFKERNWGFATNSIFIIPLSLQPGGVNLLYFKLRLFDPTDLIIWNI